MPGSLPAPENVVSSKTYWKDAPPKLPSCPEDPDVPEVPADPAHQSYTQLPHPTPQKL